jgi:hypothetical protein
VESDDLGYVFKDLGPEGRGIARLDHPVLAASGWPLKEWVDMAQHHGSWIVKFFVKEVEAKMARAEGG